MFQVVCMYMHGSGIYIIEVIVIPRYEYNTRVATRPAKPSTSVNNYDII